MERLRSLAEYKELLYKYKPVCRRGYTNNYLSTEMINRYIDIQRIYYEEEEKALIFMTDEEKYYRVYVHLSPDLEVRLARKDKPMMLRMVYREGKETEVLRKIEQGLSKQGFLLYDKSVQIVANPLEMRLEVQDKYEMAKKFLERAGINIGYATMKHINAINALREKENVLKDYHFEYETPEEIRNNVEKGYYRCAFNRQGEVCAAQQFSVDNFTVQGNWLAVEEKYKVRYGIGTAMAYHSFLYAIECEIPNYYGWVVCDNEKSLKYHQTIGYKVTDKFAAEWILE